MAAFLKFIVLGEIPGTNVQLGYTETLSVVAAIIIVSVLSFSFLYQNKRALKRRLMYFLSNDIELKTI